MNVSRCGVDVERLENYAGDANVRLESYRVEPFLRSPPPGPALRPSGHRDDESRVNSAVAIAWSSAIEDADWLEENLALPMGSTVTSIVPAGFERYVRVLHPAEVPAPGDSGEARRVRWSEVASWAGMPLEDNARFHSVALPPEEPEGTVHPVCYPPGRGGLTEPDCRALVGILRAHTAEPGDCRFCLWEGYAWQGRQSHRIPQEVLDGPRVHLPMRDYVLYRGPVEAAGALAEPAFQTPNIWWPADRSWCVASEIDLPWTYVGGSRRLVEDILGCPDLETLPAGPDDPVWRIEGWVARWVSQGVNALMSGGHCRIFTTRGVVSAWFDRPGLSPGALGVTAETTDGRRAGRRTQIEHSTEERIRRLLALHLTMNVVDLVEG
jgi:hypothetical protein